MPKFLVWNDDESFVEIIELTDEEVDEIELDTMQELVIKQK